MKSVNSQLSEYLIIYISPIFLDVPNFDVVGHPSNIKLDFLNIARLRIGNALNVLDKNLKI
jgi:hypothetical protein